MAQVPRKGRRARLARKLGLRGSRTAVLACAAVVAVAAGIGVAQGLSVGSVIVSRDGASSTTSVTTSVEATTDAEEAKPTTCVVHVDGAVTTPGVYEVSAEDARIADAVAAAGGLTADADTSQVNLAAILEDGSKVHIPVAGEVQAQADSSATAGSTSSGATSGSSSSGLVNINTATAEELDSLPGVGEATATAIIRDREANGAFTSPEDIMRVSGIGEKKYEKMQGMICV